MCDLCNGLSRRAFLGTTGALSSGLIFTGLATAEDDSPVTIDNWDENQPPVRVFVVYLGMDGAGWPKPDFVPADEIQNKFAPYLATLEKKLGDIEFIGGTLVKNTWSADEINGLLPVLEEQKADAILCIQLTFGTAAPFAALASSGLPMAIYSQLFSGHQWIYVPEIQRNGAKVIMGASGDVNDLQRMVSILRVPTKMRNAKLLMIGNPGCAAGTRAACDYANVKEKFGTEVIQITPQEFVEVHQTISDAAAVAEADEYWISKAREIWEPTREEIIKSCKTYFAMLKLMKQHGARAVAMKCLGGIPIDILGYPCLGFSRILDDGGVGACEADMDSTLTMMLFLYATGKPGFITDPVMDFQNNALIHAHCVSATRMAGPGTERLPFIIRKHLEDYKGASVKVFMDRDINQEVTCCKLANNESILVSTAVIRGVPEFDDRGCRTQVSTEVTSTSALELFDKWGGNVLGHDMMTLLHRVMFYGNHLEDFRDIARLMGLKFMIEGKDLA